MAKLFSKNFSMLYVQKASEKKNTLMENKVLALLEKIRYIARDLWNL